jgi:hypothetical protein
MSESERYSTLILVLVLLLLFGAAAVADDSNPITPAQIWNFGYVPQKSEVRHIFYLRNDGFAPLTVKEIKAGCSCTSVSRIEEPIPPGDSAAVAVTFKTGRYSGVVKKTTKVYTANTQAPEHHLKIAANVIKSDQSPPDFAITPPRLEWELRDEAIAIARDSLLIAREDSAPFSVQLLNAAHEAIDSVNIDDEIDGTVRVILYPSSGRITEDPRGTALTLRLTSADTTIMTVPIKLKD